MRKLKLAHGTCYRSYCFVFTDSLTNLRHVSLVAIDRYEASLRRKEEVRNRLEGYLYRLRDLLNGEGKSAPQFHKCSKDVERNEMTTKLDETFTWLYEEGDLAETADFLDKQATLE